MYVSGLNKVFLQVVEEDFSLGKLLESTSQAIVVRVDMGNYYLRDIFKGDAVHCQLSFQGVECLLGIPAGINEKIPIISLNQVDINIRQTANWKG